MISLELLEILRCPESRQKLALANDSLLASLNEKIAKGNISNRAGQRITEKLDAGLITVDGALFYPIRHNIPIMLVDEGIRLEVMA